MGVMVVSKELKVKFETLNFQIKGVFYLCTPFEYAELLLFAPR